MAHLAKQLDRWEWIGQTRARRFDARLATARRRIEARRQTARTAYVGDSHEDTRVSGMGQNGLHRQNILRAEREQSDSLQNCTFISSARAQRRLLAVSGRSALEEPTVETELRTADHLRVKEMSCRCYTLIRFRRRLLLRVAACLQFARFDRFRMNSGSARRRF